MEWTQELPTQTGWYWQHGGLNWDYGIEPMAVEVVPHDGETPALDVWAEGSSTPIEKYAGFFWIGPLDVPAPPELGGTV